MKKLAIVSAILAMHQAQARNVEPGTIEIMGGSTGTISSLTETSKIDTLQSVTHYERTKFNAGIAYFLTENIAIGAGLARENNTQISNGATVSDDELSLGPYAAFVAPMNDSLNLRFDALLAYTSASHDETGLAGTATGYGWDVGASINYFIAQTLSINAGVNYSHLEASGTLVGSAGSASFSRTLNGPVFSAGLSFYLK